ncbi:ArsR/SmtB family transcription factor [Bacillus manliponensis]|uniref:ArsR/SmtB family transcription factor n=1 Tax=Bacillus manliponensis TaxID=574376 RepID=UPI003511ACAB
MEKTVVDVTRAAQLLKLLGDKTRLTIVSIVKRRECCVCELVEVFNMSQPSISQHLRKLKDLGLMKEERRGQWIYYSLNENSDLYSFLEDVLQHVPEPIEEIKQIETCDATSRCCD